MNDVHGELCVCVCVASRIGTGTHRVVIERRQADKYKLKGRKSDDMHQK